MGLGALVTSLNQIYGIGSRRKRAVIHNNCDSYVPRARPVTNIPGKRLTSRLVFSKRLHLIDGYEFLSPSRARSDIRIINTASAYSEYDKSPESGNSTRNRENKKEGFLENSNTKTGGEKNAHNDGICRLQGEPGEARPRADPRRT